MIADYLALVNNEFSNLEICIEKRDTMKIDATLISHCNNGINLNEDSMKTIGDSDCRQQKAPVAMTGAFIVSKDAKEKL